MRDAIQEERENGLIRRAERWAKVAECPVCGSRGSIQPFVQAEDHHYGIKGTFSLGRCRECSLVVLDPMPTEEELGSLYPETYYSYQDFFEPKAGLKDLFRKLTFVTIGTRDPAYPKPGRMLDLGCGSGKFLYKMRAKGWETHGVEISRSAAELGRKAANLDIFPGTLHEARFPDDHFDYIRSNHSFEHILNPNETLQELRRILKPDGKLLIAVPNVDGWVARFFKRFWWLLGAPVHPFNYSPRTLPRMLEKNGFRIEKLSFNSDYANILGSMQIILNRGTGRVSTQGRLINNPILKILFHRVAKTLDLLGKGDAMEVICRKR